MICGGIHLPYPSFCKENWPNQPNVEERLDHLRRSISIRKIQKFWRIRKRRDGHNLERRRLEEQRERRRLKEGIRKLLRYISICKIQKIWRQSQPRRRDYYMQNTTRCTLPGCNRRHYNNKKAKANHMKKIHYISPNYKMKQVYKYIKNNDYKKDCGICCESLSNGETITHLPNCIHPFHMKCIDHWLGTKNECPLCRVTAGIKHDRAQNWKPDIFIGTIAHSTIHYEYIEDYQCHARTNMGHRCTHKARRDGYCGKH